MGDISKIQGEVRRAGRTAWRCDGLLPAGFVLSYKLSATHLPQTQHPLGIYACIRPHQRYDIRADMDEPNNDIDTETLQAQIDLSMAYAQNLVASWLPSSSLTHSSSSLRAAEAEAELQTLFRRPPRYVLLLSLILQTLRATPVRADLRFFFFPFFVSSN